MGWNNYSEYSTNIICKTVRLSLAGTVQNGLIHLYELNSTDGLNDRTMDGILRNTLNFLKMTAFWLCSDLRGNSDPAGN